MFEQIHNSQDVLVIDSQHPHVAKDYVDLLLDSRFGFVPAGDAHYTFRLTEVLCAGSVPVIFDDDLTPPYGRPDFEGRAVQVPEASIAGTLLTLRNFSDADISSMQQHGQRLVGGCDMRSTVDAMLQAL